MSMKGCIILAELFESGRDQPWRGNGPTQPQSMEDLLLAAISWEEASCLHLGGSYQVQAGPRVPQALATSLWSLLERSRHRDGTAWGNFIWQGLKRSKVGGAASTASCVDLSHHPANQQTQVMVYLESQV